MDRIERLVQTLGQSEVSRKEFAEQSNWIREADYRELIDLIVAMEDSLTADPVDAESPSEHFCFQVNIVLSNLATASLRFPTSFPEAECQRLVESLVRLYTALKPLPSNRALLLEVMNRSRSLVAYQTFAEQMVADPPQDGQELDRAFVPLFVKSESVLTGVFPKLLDAISQPGMATAILDLANFLTRERVADRHPASDRVDRLAALLGDVVQRLASLEQPGEGDTDLEAIRKKIGEGVGLGVALCDALALIGNKSIVGKLYQATELTHRRIQVEAFSALARLGEKEGIEKLTEFASDPSVRLRVIQYAKELDLDDSIDDQYRTSVALAEADLASWLAEPLQYGIPPTSLELFDQRELFWPGFSEIQECFLFRFEYWLGGSSYANIGFAGPSTHTFVADLLDLSPFDLYSAFAGSQTEHPDVFEVDADLDQGTYQLDREKLEQKLTSDGFESLQCEALGVFFGERLWIGRATKAEASGALGASLLESAWFPVGNSSRPVDPRLAYCVLKGRRFLRSFNPDLQSDEI